MSNDFKTGVKHGIPICLGYIPVSFTFGLMAVSAGIPKWTAILISLTNLTSAGQFAGITLISAGTAYFELGLTVFIINLRYMLMSLSISQKIDRKINTLQRMLFSFGITDETYVVASLQPNKLSSSYLFGLISMPIFGWNLGTILGVFISDLLPLTLQNAMGIALYGMFIALIVPPARKERKILVIIMIAVAIMCMFRYISIFSGISSGFRIIISSVVAAATGAYFFPNKEEAKS